MPSLRHPTKGSIGEFRGDPIEALDSGQRWSWKRLVPDLDPTSGIRLSTASRTLFERAAKDKGPEILLALLEACQEKMLERAREMLAKRRLRVQRLRALDRQEADLEREARVEAARSRRRGRSAREDGRVRRVRARRRTLETQRAAVLGDLPEAELTLTRLAGYRDWLVELIARRMRDLHSGTQQVLQRMR
jgi:hypothetical protein